jgi:hypothetical protein
MSDGVTFAGNGGMDVGDGSMPGQKSGSLSSGGPLVSPKGSEQGMIAPEGIVNNEGSVPSGGSIQSPVTDW